MNPGLPEESVKVAGSTVEALKAQPLALALVIVNVLFLAFFTYIAHSINVKNIEEIKHNREMIEGLMKQCFERKDLNP